MFDGAGNLTSSTDARHAVTRYVYDMAGRVMRAGTSSFEYGTPGTGGAGRLTFVRDDSGQTAFGYDGFGRPIFKTQSITGAIARTFKVSYAYGATGASTGHVSSVTYPSGNQIDIDYDSSGRPSSLRLLARGAALPVFLLSEIAYRPFGAVSGWTWGDGTNPSNRYTRVFDLQGNLVSYPLGYPGKNGVIRTLHYDAAGRITGTTHTGATHAGALDQTYYYDDLDRLTGFDATGTSQRYAYDQNGNRSQISFGGAFYPYTLSATSNRLTATAGPAPRKNNTYDGAGNLTSDGTISYTYGANGRMETASSAGVTTRYRYNGFGQRVAKTSSLGSTYYVYDEQGHLLGEYESTGVPLQETVYLGDLPVAVIEPGVSGPAVYYVYADHLHAPRVLTRASDQQIVWRWDHADPFGLLPPDENPSGLGTFTYNLRFPGQVFDKETNNHYNYFRDYDPQLGRYVQSDPLGLHAGVNTYAYVGGNPLRYSDPRGLTKWDGTVTVIAGQAGGGGGVSTISYSLKSECVRGQRFVVDGSGLGAYMGVGWKMGASTSSVSMNDGLDYINPYVFNGTFDLISIGASFGAGYGWSSLTLGGANAPWSGSFYNGRDAGLTSMTGQTSVKNAQWEKCDCGK